MKLFHLFVASMLSVTCANFALAQELTEFIEVHRTLAPGELIDFVFVDEFGGVTRQSIGDPESLGFVTVQVPSNAKGKYVHTPACFYVKLENAIVSSLTGGSGNVPLLVNDENDLTVVPAFLVDFLDQVPSLTLGQTFEVSAGASAQYPFGTIYAPPLDFPDLTDSDFADFDDFPTFTGTARVAEILTIHVYVVPEPASLGFASATGLILMAAYRRKKKG